MIKNNLLNLLFAVLMIAVGAESLYPDGSLLKYIGTIWGPVFIIVGIIQLSILCYQVCKYNWKLKRISKERKPVRGELSGVLRQATEAELLALTEFAEWAEKHRMILATGRQHGIRFGVTNEVANFIHWRSVLNPGTEGSIAADLVNLSDS